MASIYESLSLQNVSTKGPLTLKYQALIPLTRSSEQRVGTGSDISDYHATRPIHYLKRSIMVISHCQSLTARPLPGPSRQIRSRYFAFRALGKSKTAVYVYGWLCYRSHRQRGHLETAPHLLSIAKNVKLGFYIVPTGNRTPGRSGAVHYTTTTPRQLHSLYMDGVTLI